MILLAVETAYRHNKAMRHSSDTITQVLTITTSTQPLVVAADSPLIVTTDSPLIVTADPPFVVTTDSPLVFRI